MKTHLWITLLLALTLSGCSRNEPPPGEEPETTNTPPGSVSTSRPGPGQLGGSDADRTPLATVDTPGPRDRDVLLAPSPSTSADPETATTATETTPATRKSEGYYLSYRTRHANGGLFDAGRFTADNGDYLDCRFDRDVELVTVTARFPRARRPKDTRQVSFSINQWRESQSTYVYPWRSFHPNRFRNTPDQKGTDFAMAFAYVLPEGQGSVLGITRVYADRERPDSYANEECSEGRMTLQVDRAQKTIRGEFSCVRMWTYPHADRTMPDENGPLSITGEFYLPYTQQ